MKRDGFYYPAIMDKKNNTVFANLPKAKAGDSCFQKMTYKLLPGANKMLPKVFFSKKGVGYYNPSSEILRIRNTASHSKNGAPQDGFEKADFNLQDCHTLIDFFKASIEKHEDWKHFHFKFSPTSTYEDISGFYREVEQQAYKITFEPVPEAFINKNVDEGRLYLFQIYNKDFSAFSKGKPNLHTMYWKALFDDANLADVVYKLNGKAEVFFRKQSIEEKNIVRHEAALPIQAKNLLTPGKENVFAYELVKDRRFTMDKFQFHVPITMNFKATGGDGINNDVQDFLRDNPDVKIIGLDRGERHLVYLTLIDQQGNILLQQSLNTIADDKHPITTDYHKLLNAKEEDRAKSRLEWRAIENIKELKEGYISQVIHRIATLMVEHRAIVVMEDLNFGFKRGRFKVEKQVYQKLEKMLIDKLNYLVLKDAAPGAPGSLMKALQLASEFKGFAKMGKQSGFLFYVPAAYTSKIDPLTGFVDFLKPKYENVEASRAFFNKFDSIRYNPDAGYFEFAFDYSGFGSKAEDTRTRWTVCTAGTERFHYVPAEKKHVQIDVTEKMKELLDAEGIAYQNGADLKDAIGGVESKDFFAKLTKYLSVVLAMRYTAPAEGRDFILSPVADKNGVFFNSEASDGALPKDADANGAYHIALKGLLVLRQIDNARGEDRPNLAINNKQWLQFIQKADFKK